MSKVRSTRAASGGLSSLQGADKGDAAVDRVQLDTGGSDRVGETTVVFTLGVV